MNVLARRVLEDARAVLAATHARQWESEGENRGPWVRVYQRYVARGQAWLEGQPWCVCFVIYRAHRAAECLGLESQLPRVASSALLYRWFRARGLLLPEPEPGCIGMVRGGPTGHSHTFLVERVERAKRVVHGIDGNYKDAVAASVRPIAACDYGPIV